MPDLAPEDLLVRHAIYSCFAEGGVPVAAEVAIQLQIDIAAVRAAYERLSANHAIVLDRHTREVWMALPFSAVPTDFRVVSGDTSWYANCAWDAFGIAALLSRDVVITTSCLDCGTSLEYAVEDGALLNTNGVVHFAVPAAHWWDDIGFT